MELKIPSTSDPAYHDFIANEFGLSIKNAYRKSIKELEIGLEEKIYLNFKRLGTEKDKKKVQKNMENSSEHIKLIEEDLDGQESKVNMIRNDVSSQRNRLNGVSEEEYITQFVMNTDTVEKLGLKRSESFENSSASFHQNAAMESLQQLDNTLCEVSTHNEEEKIQYFQPNELKFKAMDSKTNEAYSTEFYQVMDKSTINEHGWIVIDEVEKTELVEQPLVEQQSCAAGRYLITYTEEFKSSERGLLSSDIVNISDRTEEILLDDTVEKFSSHVVENTPDGLITPLKERSLDKGHLFFDFNDITSNDFQTINVEKDDIERNCHVDWADFDLLGNSNEEKY